jgi:hypothetical protein
MIKRTIAAVFFGIILSLNIEASMISVYVIETGLSQNTGKNRYSELCENAFMDVLFDSGYIVSNYPMLRLDIKPSSGIFEEAIFGIDEASGGGIDYIIVTQLDYTPNSTTPEIISLFVIRTAGYQIIYEKQITEQIHMSDREALNDFKTIARGLVTFLTN